MRKQTTEWTYPLGASAAAALLCAKLLLSRDLLPQRALDLRLAATSERGARNGTERDSSCQRCYEPRAACKH